MNNILPLRPDPNQDVLVEQLKKSLSDLKDHSYQGYLAQLVQNIFLDVQKGDLRSPQRTIKLLKPVLHIAERFNTNSDELEAATSLKIATLFIEILNNTLRCKMAVETILGPTYSDIDREIFQIITLADPRPLNRAEIAAQWSISHGRHDMPDIKRVTQVLVDLHEMDVLVRCRQAGYVDEVSFYKLSRFGRAVRDQILKESNESDDPYETNQTTRP